MASRSNIVIASIAIAVVYSAVLGLLGIFGNTVQSGLIYFFTNIMPYILMLFGYFLIVFIPIRIYQATKRNSEILKNTKMEQDIQEQSENEKEVQQKILDLLNKEDSI